ncbi:MAG: IPT/TIG domain-containing protein, partial [Acidobacteriota bacterium]
MFVRRLVLSLLAATFIVTGLYGASEIPTVVTVSAASFEATSVAPDAIAATFGAQLATGTASGGDTDPLAPGVQLPTELLGARLEVNGRPAQLLFVSPAQINFVVPTQTETGIATVIVFNGVSSVANGTVSAVPISSGVFTANSDGQGVAAALAFRVRADSSTQYDPVAVFDPNTNRFVTTPVDLGPEGERVFLVIFASGLRHASDPNGDGNLNETVRVLLGGEELVPTFAGKQGDFVGLDQINVELPRSLIGRGDLSFAIAIDGAAASNPAQIAIGGESGTGGPLVSGFNVSPALAGQTVTITGSGFSTSPEGNVVRINGVEATVTSASPNELIIVIPFGAASGNVSVRTPMGEGLSGGPLLVRTSISGFIENTSREPLSGVLVKLVGSSITAQTTPEGSFVLPDVPIGTQYVEVDGESLPTTPPYPKVTLKTIAFANRDNQFARPVSLQQSNGGSGSIGSGGTLAETDGPGPGTNLLRSPNQLQDQLSNQLQPALPIPINAGGFTLLLPANISAVFPGGATSGTIFLTPLTGGRAPVDLPLGVFSSSIVQITPFDVVLTPGAKLTFPNTDGLPANSPARLYRYDSLEGRFVEEPAGATVSADGQRVETPVNAIKKTSYYFVAVSGLTSTVSGRVVESDGVTPVRRALVSLRGQETFTDGNGGYLLRYVPVKNGESIAVEASYQRPDGRIDKATSVPVVAIANGTTKVP